MVKNDRLCTQCPYVLETLSTHLCTHPTLKSPVHGRPQESCVELRMAEDPKDNCNGHILTVNGMPHKIDEKDREPAPA